MAPRQSSNKKQRKTEDHHREELKMKRTTSTSKVFNYNFSVDEFSLEEREVADALLLLQILETQYPFISTKSPSRNPLPLPPPWGLRKRRSAINVSPSPSPSPPREPIPVVQPSVPPPCSKEDERIAKQKKTSSSTSPTDPFNFSPSGSGSESPSNMEEGKEQEKIWLDTLNQLTIQIRSLKTEIPKVRHCREKLLEVNKIYTDLLEQTLSNRQVNSSIGISLRREEENRNTMMGLDQQQPSIMSDSRVHLENNV